MPQRRFAAPVAAVAGEPAAEDRGRGSRRLWIHAALAGVAMLVLAELAYLLLSPDGYEFDPAPVRDAALLEGPRLEEARDYGTGGRWLYLFGFACQAALLLALALGRPRWSRRLAARLGRRPALGSLAAGALLWIALSLASLPAGLLGHARAVEVGISTQSLGSWLYDFALGSAIGALLAALGIGLLAAIWRRFGSRWWLPGTVAVVALAAIYLVLSPILVGPAFNDFRRLSADDPVRADVLRLANAAEVDVGEVLSVDASRRGNSLNAYIGGLGPTKRVVVYDTLLTAAQRAELRSVLAHELGHVANKDLIRGLGFIALVAPLGLLFAGLLARALLARRGVVPGTPAALAALLLGIGLAVTLLGIVGNQLSRDVEASADAFALELTDDPAALIALQRRLARANLNDPDPPALTSFLLSTHPTPAERVGAALAYERER